MAVAPADSGVLTSSWAPCCSGRNAASRIATWSALSFCHSPISRITKWVALLSLVNDWNRLSWFSSTASARAITCRNYGLLLGIISQFLGPQQMTFGTPSFFFKTTWWACLAKHKLCWVIWELSFICSLPSLKKKMPKVIPNLCGQEIKIPTKSD